MSVSLSLVTAQKQSLLMQQSAALLRMSAAELSEHLLEAAQANPLLLVEFPRRRIFVSNSATDALEALAGAQEASLYAHVQSELHELIARGGLLAHLIRALIEELEPSGWIGTPLSEISQRTGVALAQVECALQLVQKRVEPAGLFARNLCECLRLQLEVEAAPGPEMCSVLDHLDVLERGGAAALARAAGLSPETVRACLGVLRGLDPKPGARFGNDPTLAREPDARVMCGPEGWRIVFNTASQPMVEVASLPRGPQRSEAVAQMLRQARGVKQAVALRLSATRRIAVELVRRQQAYFERGPEALQPLGMADLAAATGFHTSTVSRVLNGYLIDGPHGVIAARELCARAASSAPEARSRAQVMARLRAILQAEDTSHPIDDAGLVDLLRAEGIAISRRMAAKYRDLCGFAPAAVRRRHA